jgi:hypothetical protein
MLGLLIELIGIWVVFSAKADNEVHRIPLPGGGTVPVGWLVVGVGFALWLTGRIVVSTSALPRRQRGTFEHDRGWSGQVGEDLPKPEPIDRSAENQQRIDEP